MTIAVTLNGYRIHHGVEPRETLADFSRDRCRLTSVHLGCEHGACGACTVLVDGVPALLPALAITCDERSIETLEAMEDDLTMNVLRKHFHQKHGLQCGFCTPGMLMMARDILLRLPRLDELPSGTSSAGTSADARAIPKS